MSTKLNVFHYMDDLKNINEKRVWNMLSEYLDNNDTGDMCTCGICLMDIAALTLNHIPAHYQSEENITRARERTADVEIYRQLKKAIDIVTKTPHH